MGKQQRIKREKREQEIRKQNEQDKKIKKLEKQKKHQIKKKQEEENNQNIWNQLIKYIDFEKISEEKRDEAIINGCEFYIKNKDVIINIMKNDSKRAAAAIMLQAYFSDGNHYQEEIELIEIAALWGLLDDMPELLHHLSALYLKYNEKFYNVEKARYWLEYLEKKKILALSARLVLAKKMYIDGSGGEKNYEEALRILLECSESKKFPDDEDFNYEDWKNLAEAYIKNNDYIKGIKLYQHLFDKKFDEEIAIILIDFYFKNDGDNNTQKAIVLCEKFLSKKITLPPNLLASLAAEYILTDNNMDKGLEYLESLQKKNDLYKNELWYINSQCLIGVVLLKKCYKQLSQNIMIKQEDLLTIITHYKKLLECYEEMLLKSEKWLIADIYSEIAKARYLLSFFYIDNEELSKNNFHNAIICIKKSLKLAEKTRDNVIYNIAIFSYYQLQDYEAVINAASKLFTLEPMLFLNFTQVHWLFFDTCWRSREKGMKVLALLIDKIESDLNVDQFDYGITRFWLAAKQLHSDLQYMDFKEKQKQKEKDEKENYFFIKTNEDSIDNKLEKKQNLEEEKKFNNEHADKNTDIYDRVCSSISRKVLFKAQKEIERKKPKQKKKSNKNDYYFFSQEKPKAVKKIEKLTIKNKQIDIALTHILGTLYCYVENNKTIINFRNESSLFQKAEEKLKEGNTVKGALGSSGLKTLDNGIWEYKIHEDIRIIGISASVYYQAQWYSVIRFMDAGSHKDVKRYYDMKKNEVKILSENISKELQDIIESIDNQKNTHCQ